MQRIYVGKDIIERDIRFQASEYYSPDWVNLYFKVDPLSSLKSSYTILIYKQHNNITPHVEKQEH